MNRRQFLEAGAVAGCAGISLSGCIGFHYVNSSLAGNRLAIRKDDFGSGRFALVDAPGLALPLYLGMRSAELDRVAEALEGALR